jgi:hypothetical protein
MLIASSWRIQAHGKSPKALIMLSRAKQAVDALEMALREGSEREDELLQLLVENLAPMYEEAAANGGGGGGGGGGGTARTISPTKTATPKGPLEWGSTPRSSMVAATVRRPGSARP